MTAYLISSLRTEGGMQDSCWAVGIPRSCCLVPMSLQLLGKGLAHWHLCPPCQISRGCPRTVCPDAEPVSMHRRQRVDGQSPGSCRGSDASRGGPAYLEGVHGSLGLFLLVWGSAGSMVVRREVEGARVSCAPDLMQCYDIFWRFPGFNVKYFWGLYFAPARSCRAAPCVDEILSTGMLQRLG